LGQRWRKPRIIACFVGFSVEMVMRGECGDGPTGKKDRVPPRGNMAKAAKTLGR
jgi:hypothetical protein